ncbi:MAG: hypothetical protein INR71_02970, partial [Terriglobus roseus]|nr:hypothetical protein [Terriglobus roseus]
SSADWHDAEPDDALVQKYRELVVDGHAAGCLWRRQGCAPDIYRIRMADAAQWRADLADRYHSLLAIRASLPDALKMPDDVDPPFDLAGLRAALAGVLVPPRPAAAAGDADTPDVHLPAAALALLGWRADSPHGIHLATCARCFQRIGLWLYSRNPADQPRIPRPASPDADDGPMRFDLAGLHRDFCPWVCAESQAGVGAYKGLPAWAILVRLVEGSGARARDERAAAGENSAPGGSEEEEVVMQEKTREEVEREDREREGRLARLRRVFTVGKGGRDKRRA